MQIAQDIASRMYVKKRRHSELRRGFFACIVREIVKPRYVSYFFTIPKYCLCNSQSPLSDLNNYSKRQKCVSFTIIDAHDRIR